MDWKVYQQKTQNRNPSKLLEEALQYVNGKNALDFGAGALADSRYLLNKGFSVTALDSTAMTSLESPRFVHAITPFEKYIFIPHSFDLIHGRLSFPFVPSKYFNEVWNGIRSSLKHGGIITGEFFGPKDTWTQLSISEQDVYALFVGFEILKFEAREYDKEDSQGRMKHWHVFSLIARK